MSNKHYENLVAKGHPVGEVSSVDKFLVRVKGMQPVNPQSLIMFDDGSKGIVYHVLDDHSIVLHLGARYLKAGTGAVVQHHELVAKVGKGLIGRVLSVTGQPLDGKGPIAPDAVWPVFKPAPPLIGRQQLDDQLETGVTAIDALFPIVLGQRIAVIGESKTGKSTLMTQLALNQKGTDRVVVYAMVAKRRADVDALLNKLHENDAMKNSIVVVATMFESLVMSYLCPYVACSIAEYLWQEAKMDSIIIYDDLTSHAQAYREISLLANVSPGRDSFPGDMFYAHSSLLERAGRLAESGKTLTSLPIVLANNGDITAYLPTNIMSITDGQLILDMDIFHEGIRPAVSTGLSVSRVGGRGHNDRQKNQLSRIQKTLSKYNEAAEFSHFGSELALEAKKDLDSGKRIFEAVTQGPSEYHSLIAQQLMLETILDIEGDSVIDMDKVKANVNELAKDIGDDEKKFEAAKEKLKKSSMIELKK